MRVNTRYIVHQVRVTVGDLGLRCCTLFFSFRFRLMNISTTWILIPTASILTTVGQVNLLWLLKEGRSASTGEWSQQKSHSVGESQSRKRHSSKPEQDLIPCPLNVTDFRHDVEHIYNRFLIAWPQKRTLSNHRKPWRHLG